MQNLTRREHPSSTARLYLPRLTLDDAPLMLAIWNDPDFVRYVGDRGIRTLADTRTTLQQGVLRLYSDHGYGPYAMVLRGTGKSIGICGLFKRDSLDDPDIGFAILPDYRGLGYVFEAAQSVVAYARDQLSVPRVAAIVAPENAASVSLIRKLGLEFERMHRLPGDADDVALYAMQLQRATGA